MRDGVNMIHLSPHGATVDQVMEFISKCAAKEKAQRDRIAELEGRLRCWRDDYVRSADGALVTIPVHQICALIGET